MKNADFPWFFVCLPEGTHMKKATNHGIICTSQKLGHCQGISPCSVEAQVGPQKRPIRWWMIWMGHKLSMKLLYEWGMITIWGMINDYYVTGETNI